MKIWVILVGIFCCGLWGGERLLAIPDFMILGVTKCGTTSLYNYMVAHPKILGANRKEIHFFDWKFKRSIKRYEQQFPEKKDPSSLTGEATPSYFWKKKCLRRIFQECPKTKFIVIFRDPVKRIISEYFRRKNCAQESLSFDQAIVRPDTWDAYLGAGMYARHLMRWLSVFPKEQIHILFLEELSASPEQELNKIFAFLGVKKYRLDSYEIYNEAKKKSDVISAETIRFLKHFYEPYDKKLEQLLGRKLPWKKAQEPEC